MTKSEKLLLWLAIVGVLVAAVFAFLVVKQKNQAIADKAVIAKELADKDDELSKVKDKLSEDQNNLTQTSSQLAEINSKATNLQTGLETAEKRSTDLESALKAAEDKIETAEQRLQQMNEQLQGKSAEDIKAANLQAKSELIAAMAEQRNLEAQLQAANAEVQRANNALHREATGEIPPGLSGKVESVNKPLNFIVLSLGDKDGVVRNGVLVVYRNNQFIGRVKVVSTTANNAVADILPDATKTDIQPGDDVLN